MGCGIVIDSEHQEDRGKASEEEREQLSANLLSMVKPFASCGVSEEDNLNKFVGSDSVPGVLVRMLDNGDEGRLTAIGLLPQFVSDMPGVLKSDTFTQKIFALCEDRNWRV